MNNLTALTYYKNIDKNVHIFSSFFLWFMFSIHHSNFFLPLLISFLLLTRKWIGKPLVLKTKIEKPSFCYFEMFRCQVSSLFFKHPTWNEILLTRSKDIYSHLPKVHKNGSDTNKWIGRLGRWTSKSSKILTSGN